MSGIIFKEVRIQEHLSPLKFLSYQLPPMLQQHHLYTRKLVSKWKQRTLASNIETIAKRRGCNNNCIKFVQKCNEEIILNSLN